MTNVREGQTYVCVKSNRPWWTKGKEYNTVLNKYGEMSFVDNDGAKWTIEYLNNRTDCQFKLKEKPSRLESEKLKYTTFDVNKVILRAYNMYDNDAQRLAFIKGYFAK